MIYEKIYGAQAILAQIGLLETLCFISIIIDEHWIIENNNLLYIGIA